MLNFIFFPVLYGPNTYNERQNCCPLVIMMLTAGAGATTKRCESFFINSAVEYWKVAFRNDYDHEILQVFADGKFLPTSANLQRKFNWIIVTSNSDPLHGNCNWTSWIFLDSQKHSTIIENILHDGNFDKRSSRIRRISRTFELLSGADL